MFVPKRVRVVIACAALLAVGIGLGDAMSVFASSSNNVVSTCVDRSSGDVRYLLRGRCRKTEFSVSWNVQGPVGKKGDRGEQGLQGPRGATGESGVAGISGQLGATGPQGPQGPQGIQGPAGADGSLLSNTIRSGSGTPSNSLGSNGDFYMDVTANRIHGPKSSGVWPSGVSVIGPSGATGAQGLAGQGVLNSIPAVVISKNNIDTDNIALSSFTTIATIGSSVELSGACGYDTISTPSNTTLQLALKAPAGSSAAGQTSSITDMLIATPDGNRGRVSSVGDGRVYELAANRDFIILNVHGSSGTPVIFYLTVSKNANSCSVSGTAQSV
jgi:hypothetical protein